VLLWVHDPVSAQGTGEHPAAIQHRNDCRLAGRALTTGEPHTRQQWAAEYIEGCPEEGPPIIAGRWAGLPDDTSAVAELLRQSTRFEDARIYEQARRVALDRSRSDVVRVGAMFVLARYVDQYDAAWFNEVAPPAGLIRYVRTPLGSALDSTSITGSASLTGSVREPVSQLLEQIAASRSAEPKTVWYAAAALAKRIRVAPAAPE
jgi:hypothetical protein